MGARSIPVDLFNPGQVFACLGFWEAITELAGPAQGRFDWEAGAQAHFHLDCPSVEDPILEVLSFLGDRDLKVIKRVPSACGSQGKVAEEGVEHRRKQKVETSNYDHHVYPSSRPRSNSSLVVELIDAKNRVLIFDYWFKGRVFGDVKFWQASNAVCSGSILKNATTLIQSWKSLPAEDPFNEKAPQSSAFRFDWRRDYIALDVGFSPNEHQKKIVMVGYPVVEIMAAYGLRSALPRRKNELHYTYGIIGHADVPLIFHRAALGCSILPFSMRSFDMHLGWPGRKDDARCITQVSEVTP